MDYNSTRPLLRMREYGRLVQQMVSNALTIEDRSERYAYCLRIIQLMTVFNPQIKRYNDYQSRLWHHLAHISNYQLDIDYPCEIQADHLQFAHKPVPYPQSTIQRRHYGHLTEVLMQQLHDMEDADARKQMIMAMVHRMKRCLVDFHSDMGELQRIADDIAYYTHGKVTAEEVMDVYHQYTND